MKKGILIINLGTPEAPTVGAVRRYLKVFLGDKRVLVMPAVVRKILLHAVILPFRPFKTAKAYQSVWDPKLGSPLRYHSEELVKKLEHKLGSGYVIKLGMRYGSPSIEQALKMMLPDIDTLTILPLFPQYASSTSGSAIEYCLDYFKNLVNIPSIKIVHDFYNQPWYIDATCKNSRPHLDAFKPDHVIMSFHGLPVRHLENSEKSVCQGPQSCPGISSANRFCYRAQCYETARLLSTALGIQENCSVAFQSRLGRVPWIKPYIDQMLPELYAQGHRRLSVICPSFVVDCLETIEEIGIRLKDEWLKLGGEAFQLVPCLNSEPHWIDALSSLPAGD